MIPNLLMKKFMSRKRTIKAFFQTKLADSVLVGSKAIKDKLSVKIFFSWLRTKYLVLAKQFSLFIYIFLIVPRPRCPISTRITLTRNLGQNGDTVLVCSKVHLTKRASHPRPETDPFLICPTVKLTYLVSDKYYFS